MQFIRELAQGRDLSDNTNNPNRETFHPLIAGESVKKFLGKALALGAAAAIAFGGANIAPTTPAAAATVSTAVVAAKKQAPVTIKTIGKKTVKGSAKATIKPSYSKAKSVKVKSAVLTVKKGKKTVAKNKKSVKLGAGTYTVTTTVKYTVKGKKSTVSKKQTLKVVKAKSSSKKRSVKMNGQGYSCPKGYPVKGNRTGSNKEWKYHVPGGQYYSRTKPEECFKTERDAQKAGYRASKR